MWCFFSFERLFELYELFFKSYVFRSFVHFSYKQQHQLFIQHASQQITVLDQQKLALKGQTQTPQQVQVQVQAQTQAPPDLPQHSHIPNDCDPMSINLNSVNGNANNFIGNNRNSVPPPLMSQNIAMPRSGVNPSYISSQSQPQPQPHLQQRINFSGDNSFQVG